MPSAQDLFNIGLHGPDLLFYYHPLTNNPVNSKGYGIHSEAGIKFFSYASKEIVRRSFSPDHLAYIYGVICHFALDRECHGYIDEKITESGVSHAEIEVEFDRRLMIYNVFTVQCSSIYFITDCCWHLFSSKGKSFTEHCISADIMTKCTDLS